MKNVYGLLHQSIQNRNTVVQIKLPYPPSPHLLKVTVTLMTDLCSEWFRITTRWLPKGTLEELDNRLGEGQLGGLFLHQFRCQLVLNHELGQVTHYL